MKDVGYNTLKHLYESGVTPILEYGSGVGGYVKSKEIETVQNKAMKFYLGVHRLQVSLGILGGQDHYTFTQIFVYGALMEQTPNYGRQSDY